MGTEESNKFSSNLKVPPLKIVLSSHQNNSVMNVSRVSADKEDSNNEHGTNPNDQRKDSSRRASLDDSSMDEPPPANGGSDRQSGKRGSRSNIATSRSLESEQSTKASAEFSSASSSSSTASDRSTSTSPSSESESLASNSTIISDQQQQVKTTKTEPKDDSNAGNPTATKNETRPPRANRASNLGSSSNKRSHDGHTDSQMGETTNSSTNTSSTYEGTRDQKSNTNQRITRSSQRAAQQNRSDNQSESQNDDNNVVENQEKSAETARKVKRRKGEPQESELDSNQPAAPQPIVMANIYPGDYQPPAQNCFELYRDIRERPHKKMMELSHIQPKVPLGFKDYLINGGPYLLDGNKLGVGLNGLRLDECTPNQITKVKSKMLGRGSIRMRITNLKKEFSAHQPSQQRHNSYAIPKSAEAPKSLQAGSPLHELFVDQEKARQQMRMQHLKERERSILAAEQEILRAYSKAAMADVGQKLHLSACTYFYYQERYHYLDDKTNLSDKHNSNEVPHSQDNSFLCIEGGETSKIATASNESRSKPVAASSKPREPDDESMNIDGSVKQQQPQQDNNSVTVKKESEEVKISPEAKDEELRSDTGLPNKSENLPGVEESNDFKTIAGDNKSDDPIPPHEDCETKKSFSDNSQTLRDTTETVNAETKVEKSTSSEKQEVDSDSGIAECIDGKQNGSSIKSAPSEDSKEEIRKVFLDQLQEIDDKWAKIRAEMCKRHQNEADSLFAIQSLDWEWKAKEIGSCDVRVTLKVDPEFVPRVEVSALDY